MEDQKLDLYAILGLEAGADERQVAKAYKKKSLVHHPDRGGDVKKFLELKHARDILLDPKKKEEYDKKLSQELQAQKRQREREAELDEKRRHMRDELLRKENASAPGVSSTSRRSEINKLRERGLARQKELQEKVAREARRREELRRVQEELDGRVESKSQRTVTFKWDKSKYSHSDETICDALRSYGEIESVKLKSSSAKVLFRTAIAAAVAVRTEGHNPQWRAVVLQGHIVETEESACGKEKAHERTADATKRTCLPSGPIDLDEHLQFEEQVLQQLRQAAEVQARIRASN